MRALDWPGKAAFNAAPVTNWTTAGVPAGTVQVRAQCKAISGQCALARARGGLDVTLVHAAHVRSAQNSGLLSFVRVFLAGHMVR